MGHGSTTMYRPETIRYNGARTIARWSISNMGIETGRTARMRKLGRRIARGVENDEAQAARTQKRVEDTLAFLRRHGLPGSNDRVLDIGCGAGRFASALSQHAGHVTGIDLSPEALAAAERQASSLGLANVDFLLYDFLKLSPEELGWARGFDLVFAGLVPRCMRKSFVGKMEVLTAKHCFMQALITLSDEPGDTMKREFLGLRPTMAQSRLPRFEQVVDDLRREGCNPIVHFYHEDSETPVTDVEQFAEETLDTCLADDTPSWEREAFVRQIRKRAEEEGGLVRRIARDSGWLLWDVREKA